MNITEILERILEVLDSSPLISPMKADVFRDFYLSGTEIPVLAKKYEVTNVRIRQIIKTVESIITDKLKKDGVRR